MKKKICTKCGAEKPIDQFHKNKNCRFGVSSICGLCTNAYTKRWYTEHTEHTVKYRAVNREKIKTRMKRWRAESQEKIKNYNKEYRTNHREQIREQRREYMRKYSKKRCVVDLVFRLNKTIRSAVGDSLRGNKKGARWEKICGYTLEKLRKHLERQFIDDMSWSNYGRDGWVIDHKIPISVFNFTKPNHEDFKKCWALSNLQPMWAKENIIKSDKLDKHFQPSLLI